MSILAILQKDMITAMKAGEKSRLSTVRMLISAIKYAQVDKPDMGDEEMLTVLQREAKKRREAIEAYRNGGREEAAKNEEEELRVIQAYLPVMMSEEEVRSEAKQILSSTQFPNFGAAMGAVMGKMKGRAEGNVVSKIVKELYK